MSEHQDPNTNGAPLDPADERAIDMASGDAAREPGGTINRAQRDESERAAASLHAALTPKSEMPRELRDRLLGDGLALVGARNPLMEREAPAPKRGRWLPLALAASIALAITAAIVGVSAVQQRNAALETERQLVADLRQRIQTNQTLLASANDRVDELRAQEQQLRTEVAQLDETATDQQRQLAMAAQREADLAARGTELATMLASATSDLDLLRNDLDRAQLTIARYEAPADPALLKGNREKLLEVPGTFLAQWSPFNVPDLPASEQPNVTGDVVWNDELQTGYLRFVGLDPNDPNIEQYQVWVIDERGLEQKVSGGVFDVTDAGEVIVPIEPGIEVGRVALFAITVEDPGGTWVPDLTRRVVVAPRSEG